MSWQFSKRTSWDTGESAFAQAVRQARHSGRRLFDLTISNPTVCGFTYPAQALLSPLADPRSLTYDPDPRGLPSAREAVALYYASHGAPVSPGDLILTTSTSEAYSFVFRLLCDPGDDLLIARPSYPLFDFLADLDDVRLRPYPLFYDHGWWIDFAELERAIGPRTRAIVVVHPNNPTGHATSRAERAQLEALCARHRLALIVDEVFLDYPMPGAPAIESFAVGPHPVPTFVLSGMSKIAGLPQMKSAWIAVCGPANGPAKPEALARLEVIADTFLSMNAPVQLALPTWLANREQLRAQIGARVADNLRIVSAAGVPMLQAEAGWSATLRLPQRSLEVATDLLARRVVVHPGEFYGMAERGRAVISLIGPSDDLREGIAIIRQFCAE